MTEQEKKVFSTCGLFAGIPEEETERLLTCLGAETADVEKNEIIWHMGDRVESCAVILSGALRAEAVNASGVHSLMAFHRPGGLVGDVLMATPGGTSPVYVIAAEQSRVLYLPYSRIMAGCSRCCKSHARLRENLVSEIAGKFWMQRRRAGYLSAHSLRVRLAMYLLDRSRDSGCATFSLGCTREDLADYLCVNRSAMCRELGRMKAEGMLDCYRDTFRLLEPGELAKLVP